MIAQKPITVGLVWLAALLALLLVYPQFGEMATEKVPYSFLLLAPFGLRSFPQWVVGAGVSYWAIRALGWNEPSTRKAAKWVGIGAVCVLALHAAWVLFVVTKGGL
jgi:hypothetical protein